MKKAIFILFILVVILLTQIDKSDELVIPKDAIRYRIIANSNSEEDQNLKREINKEIEPVINNVLLKAQSLNQTRLEIKKTIPEIESKIQNFNVDYKINYGNNYFPQKELYGVVYPAGEYESLVVTLGEGLGDNWWCVLFPPLCLIEAHEDELDEVTYSFYTKKIIDKFINK